MQRSGYHHVANELGVILPEDSMHLIPSSIDVDRAREIAIAIKVTRRDHLLVVDGDFKLKLIERIRRVTRARIYAVFHQTPKGPGTALGRVLALAS
jgi:hypothetical protein